MQICVLIGPVDGVQKANYNNDNDGCCVLRFIFSRSGSHSDTLRRFRYYTQARRNRALLGARTGCNFIRKLVTTHESI